MNREQKINVLSVPISLGLIGVVTIILAICKQSWLYCLIGGLTGMMCHSLMVKQNARMTRFAKLDPEHKVYNPKRSAILWGLLRLVLLLGVFTVLIIKADIVNDKSHIFMVVCAMGGYVAAKIGFIVCLLTIKEKYTPAIKNEEIQEDKADIQADVEEEVRNE